MKTTSMQAKVIGDVQRPEPFVAPPHPGYKAGGYVPVWLPTPPLPVKPRSATPKATTSSLWMAPEPESLGEKVMFGALAAGAAAAVLLGFGSMADLVQTWPLLNQWVAQLLQ